jgi:5-oxoprolinase (ATP-hydrolysing)
VRIAVENMANAIKKISIARGHDVTRYTLACFGGAGGQHACLVADALGMGTIMIHPLAGVLSAYGMGVADMTELKQRSLGDPLGTERLEELLAELADEAEAALRRQGGHGRRCHPAARGAALRGQRQQPRSAGIGRNGSGVRGAAQVALRLLGRGNDNHRRDGDC